MRLAIVTFFVIFIACSGSCARPPSADLNSAADQGDITNLSEQALKQLALLHGQNGIKPPEEKIQALRKFLLDGDYKKWRADQSPRTNNVRLTGPSFGGDSYSTHARVRIYYSEGVYQWLVDRQENPEAVLPEGSMMVKEMYPPNPPANSAAIAEGEDAVSGWAVMVRDTSVSHDGWLWYLYYLPDNLTNQHEFELAQYGLSFCVSCHASTSNPEGTFAALGNITGEDIVSYVDVPNPRDLVATKCPTPSAQPQTSCSQTAPSDLASHDGGHRPPAPRQRCDGNDATEVSLMECLAYTPIAEPRANPDPEFLAQFNLAKPSKPNQLPPDIIYDHVVAGGSNSTGLVTADACEGCHDATNLLKVNLTNMAIPAPAALRDHGLDWINLAPMGEWTGSLMGRSSRDPIFRAQAESEVLLAPEHADATLRTCMSCHAPMGQRQLAHDKGDNATLSLAMLDAIPEGSMAEDAIYGSLGRDGVSCVVCHRITDKNLGSKESFTANFDLGPVDEIYGPYEEVITDPMEQGVGMTPTHGPQITDSALCGSCHTVYLPVYGSNPPKKVYEQTTYLEWKNSVFQDETSENFKACIDCHMPNTDPLNGTPLHFKIANIEDGSFPYVPNRLPDEALEMTERENYRRHTLVGVNRFVQEMFAQFPGELGASVFEPNRSPAMTPSLILTKIATTALATRETALVEASASRSGDNIIGTVTVTNLGGHKLPTGVGFRRTFLELALLDGKGNQVWCSGCTNALGLVVGSDGQPLPSEYSEANAYQPDYATISNQSEVQIYETRHRNCAGQLTTSFMALCDEIKDNRILPLGWTADGDDAGVTKPIGVTGDSIAGEDSIQIQVPIVDAANAVQLRVRLMYQATPPYYLRDRFAVIDSGPTPHTDRLAYLTSHLKLPKQGDIADWKLMLAENCTDLTDEATTTGCGG